VTAGSVWGTHRMIDPPHEDRQERFVGPKQFDFLVFYSEVFLFELGQPRRSRQRHYRDTYPKLVLIKI
jgi:hypothetical protein